MSRFKNLQLISGTADRPLTDEIGRHLEVKASDVHVGKFPDGEIDVKANCDVRGSDVFIVQSTCTPVNDNLMELLIIMDTVRRASADRITAVVPYFGYARKDRKDEGRVPISAKLVANLITRAGADRVITIDLHANQIQGFFDIPVDHLYASPVFLDAFAALDLERLTMLAPDVGSTKRASAYAKLLKGELAIIDKRRYGPDKVEVANVIGNLENRQVIIIDDMIATGGSICEAARIARDRGAEKVYLAATHAVFAGSACEKLTNAPVEKIFVANTIPSNGDDLGGKLIRLSTAPLLAEAISRVHNNKSISSLFDQGALEAKGNGS